MNKEIGIIGLGKMGENLARNLLDHGWRVVAYNRTESVTRELADGTDADPAFTYEELVEKLTPPRLVWVMVPSGKPVESVLVSDDGILHHLEEGDILIDGGNSNYNNTVRRAKMIARQDVHFMDVGVSGGPSGARNGACMMIGCEREVFDTHEELFADSCVEDGYGHMGPVGAGHFVKMVHNGIEYGMMQAIAEGFDLMHGTDEFELDLATIARVYNNGSVIESQLIEWMQQAFEAFGSDLEGVSGSAQASGEGEWTVEAAKRQGFLVNVIEDALVARLESQKKPSYQGRVIQALRNAFGGHALKEDRPIL